MIERSLALVRYARSVRDWNIEWRSKWNTESPRGLKKDLSPPPDGILSTITEPKLLRVLSETACPIISLVEIPDSYGIPVVTLDNRAVGRMAADYFLTNGFRSFACVHFPDHRHRMQGFADRLSESGQSLGSAYEVEGMHLHPERFSAWLKSLPWPTAVFCSNDIVGWHTSEFAYKTKLDVPSQIALLGVDNDERFCLLAHPHLSSIRLPSESVGYQAAHLLDQQMESPRSRLPPSIHLPPVDIVVRASSDIVAIEDQEVARVVRTIRARYTEPISMTDLLEGVPVSKRQMERRFQQNFGRSMFDILRETRCQRARELLANSHLKIIEIAEAAGFTSLANFNRTFREFSGQSPSDWRKGLLNPNPVPLPLPKTSPSPE
jgi:LacI family transcriptional regulator